MESNYTKLIATLRECFMLDQADLDFGIYRIMNSRRTEIETFLEKDLIPQVKTVLESAGTSDKGSLEKELQEAISNAKSLGADPETLPKVREIRERLANASDLTALENEVFSHLTNFFRRYFDAGDFISMRRYKKDVYAIPYEGEEVKLHWANADQYYIKTSEFFKNYRFKTESGKSVVFTLVEASTEQNNNKAQGDKERKFKIYTPSPSSIEQGKPAHTIEEIDGELHVYFIYEPMDKGVKQDALIGEAFDAIKDSISSEYLECLAPSSTEKDKSRTLIQKHINDYVKRNTFDYFIHKDLYGFLTRELDFYIKNEILFIDDIDSRSPDSFIGSFSMIKAVKQIGEKIITFLAQLEEFQKKLFLKKKMVVETGYCITLDRIDEAYYDDIRTNEAQIDDWISLFAIDELDGFSHPLSREFLQNNLFLVLDTKHFDESWKNKLIGEISESHNLDEWLDGLMINSENFQVLNLLQERYKEDIRAIYIDPPYNTSASEIIYKNSFKDSSWLSLIENRLSIGVNLLEKNGICCVAIDDEEVLGTRKILDSLFYKNLGIAIVRSNPVGRKTKGRFTPNHEYALFYGKSENSVPGSLPKSEKGMARYPYTDDIGRYTWLNFIRTGNNDLRTDSPTMYYPIFVGSNNAIRIPKMQWVATKSEYILLEEPNEDEEIVYPIKNEKGTTIEKNWQRGFERMKNELDEYRIRRTDDGIKIDFKARMDEEALPITWWDDAKYASSNYGASEMKELFVDPLFSYPKSCQLVVDCLRASKLTGNNNYVLDFFAGSGTTGHAVINLNREDGKDGGEMGRRKYILVEMGEYFDTVTKPRIQKVIYSEDWKDGKPVSRKGSSHAFKYLKLESYEDALNNLRLQRSEVQQGVLFAPENTAFRESYILGYMLDTESRGSILSIDYFAHPFDFEMDITRNNETTRTRVDLVETFNYLIGLVVEHSYEARGYRVVKGRTLDGERILIVWRDFDKHSNEDLNNFLQKSTYNPLDTEFDRIYINGDNSVENMKTGEQTWKVVLIEEEFKNKMFEV